jgi:hypothetical protein
MTKAKITFLVEVEYEMSAENYPDGCTPEQMLAIDLAGANEDPYLTIDDNATWTITGMLLSEA